MPKKFGRIHLVVMDSVGIGAAPDADKFFNHDVETHEAINDDLRRFYQRSRIGKRKF